jgi:hypothetical protein
MEPKAAVKVEKSKIESKVEPKLDLKVATKTEPKIIEPKVEQ